MAERPRFQRVKEFINRHAVGIYGGGGGAAFGIEQLAVSQPRDVIIPAVLSLGAISIDHLKTNARKKASRNGEEIFNSASLANMDVSPNPYADLLEECLGITFPAKPNHIELNTKNNIRLALRHPSKFLSTIAIGGDRGVMGQYFSEFNTFITKEGVSPLTSLHENMHSFIDGTNPDFIAATRLAPKIAILDIYDKVTDPSFDGEKFAAMFMCSEGLAEWSAHRVFFDIVQQRRESQAGIEDLIPNEESEEAIMLNYIDNNNGFLLYPFPGLESYEATTDYIHSLQQLLGAESKRVKRAMEFGRIVYEFRHDQDASYRPGVYFIDGAMHILLGSGMSRKDALEDIILTPPVTLDEIKNPENYAIGLLNR